MCRLCPSTAKRIRRLISSIDCSCVCVASFRQDYFMLACGAYPNQLSASCTDGNWYMSALVHVSSAFPYLYLCDKEKKQKRVSWERAIQYKQSGDWEFRAHLCLGRCAPMQFMKVQSLVLGFCTRDSKRIQNCGIIALAIAKIRGFLSYFSVLYKQVYCVVYYSSVDRSTKKGRVKHSYKLSFQITEYFVVLQVLHQKFLDITAMWACHNYPK